MNNKKTVTVVHNGVRSGSKANQQYLWLRSELKENEQLKKMIENRITEIKKDLFKIEMSITRNTKGGGMYVSDSEFKKEEFSPGNNRTGSNYSNGFDEFGDLFNPKF